MKYLGMSLVLLSIAILLGGCAAGWDSLSGGSVPIGTIDGYAYTRSATGTAVPAQDLTVQLLADQTVIQTATTNVQGHFHFNNIVQATATVHIDDTLGNTADLSIEASTHGHAKAVLFLTGNDLRAATMTLSPPSAQLAVGATQPFTATVLDAGSNPLDIPVSWLVQGDIGDITPDGVFTATTAGEGRIKVQYKSLKATADVTVAQP